MYGSPVKNRETTAVSYGRQSHGQQQSIDQQDAAAQRVCAAEGWTLAAHYSDGSSASRFATKDREDWALVLAGMEAREFGVLILWESSRGSRKASAWLALLETARECGVRIYVTSHERLYDLNIAADWKVLAAEGVDSQYESEKISARVRRAHAANAEAGEPTGRTPLGYVRLYDPITRKRLAQIPDDHPDAIAETARMAAASGEEPRKPHAPMIREMYARLAAGEALRAITRKFEEDGWRTVKGTAYTPAHLRVLAAQPCYAGLRAHLPGNRNENPTMYGRTPDVQIFPGKWEPLVPREQWEQVQAIYAERYRKGIRPTRAVNLLTVIAICDKCEGPMSVRVMPGDGPKESRPMAYTCRDRTCVSIRRDPMDAYVAEVICQYLEREDLTDDMARLAAPGEDVQALRDEIAALRARLDALAENLELSESILAKRSAAIEREIAALVKRERAASTPPALAGLVETGPGMADRWAQLPLEVQRQIAQIVLVPELLGRLRVQRSTTSSGHRAAPPWERLSFDRVA